jgi:hypothetical protein
VKSETLKLEELQAALAKCSEIADDLKRQRPTQHQWSRRENNPVRAPKNVTALSSRVGRYYRSLRII